MSVVTVRRAAPDDVAAIARIYREASLCNEGDRPALLKHPEALVWSPDQLERNHVVVACVEAEVVGFASTSAPVTTTVELEDLFVDPTWWRRGVATELLTQIAATARLVGVRCIEVTANPHALAFYARVGFTDAGTVDTEFGPGHRMRRQA